MKVRNADMARHGYGVTHTLEATATFMGITCEWVQQIGKQAKARMKSSYGINSLVDLL